MSNQEREKVLTMQNEERVKELIREVLKEERINANQIDWCFTDDKINLEAVLQMIFKSFDRISERMPIKFELLLEAMYECGLINMKNQEQVIESYIIKYDKWCKENKQQEDEESENETTD